jgi:hypothetical protein
MVRAKNGEAMIYPKSSRLDGNDTSFGRPDQWRRNMMFLEICDDADVEPRGVAGR